MLANRSQNKGCIRSSLFPSHPAFKPGPPSKTWTAKAWGQPLVVSKAAPPQLTIRRIAHCSHQMHQVRMSLPFREKHSSIFATILCQIPRLELQILNFRQTTIRALLFSRKRNYKFRRIARTHHFSVKPVFFMFDTSAGRTLVYWSFRRAFWKKHIRPDVKLRLK